MKSETLKLVYFAYFHSIVSYGIISGGNSMDSKRVFYIQLEQWQALNGEPLVGNYLRSLIFFH
jgi:hypothetical protein